MNAFSLSFFLSLIFGVLTAADGEADGLLLGDEVGALVGENVSDPPQHAQHACEAVNPWFGDKSP